MGGYIGFNRELENRKLENKNTVLCEICGKDTIYHATKRCSNCWDMERGLRTLADKDKSKAIKWLEDNLKSLKGK